MNYKNIVNGFSILLFLCCSLGYGQSYQSKHFVIHSDMDYRYVNIVQSNIEAYYEQILAMYFAKGWDKPLDIYYSETQSDTQSLIGKYGYNDKIYYGIYLGNMSAIFTHRLMDEGELSGLGTLFHEITHCLVNFNYNTPPVWFNEGLATFLGEQTRMVGDRLILGQPNPWRERALQNMIENGWQVDIKYLFSLSHEQFYAQRDNYHPTRAFFYWLYEKNYLKNYMDNIRLNGYGVSVLEKTVGLTSEQINEELTSFIKANCYPAAYIQNGIFAENKEQKKQCFEAALQIKPSYQPAMLKLARCNFQDKDYVKCKNTLVPIIESPRCIQYVDSLKLMAAACYEEKKYTDALKFYEKAWEFSDYDEYKYEIAFRIGICYQFLGYNEDAEQWYKKFLEINWEPTRLPELVRYVQTYLEKEKQKVGS